MWPEIVAMLSSAVGPVRGDRVKLGKAPAIGGAAQHFEESTLMHVMYLYSIMQEARTPVSVTL